MAQLISMLFNRLVEFIPMSSYFEGKGSQLLSFGDMCHVIKTKGMVFRYMWVYSKEDTMALTYRAVVTS